MVTMQDALDYLGIDETDEVIERRVQKAMKSGEAMMRGAVGDDVEKYLPGDPRIDDLVLYFTGEAYDDRWGSQKQASARSRHAQDLELQLKAELRRAKAVAGGDSV